MAPQLNARVLQRTVVSSDLVILRVKPEGWDIPKFKAGQFAVLGLPTSAPRVRESDPEPEPEPGAPDRWIRRAYSVASASDSQDYLEFYVSIVRSGELTPRLFALEPGDGLFIGKRLAGLFTLDDVRDGANVLFLATGTGLAPYMSMLRTSLPCGSDRRFAVIHGARHSWDLGYRSELNTIARLCSNFRYAPIVSLPEDEFQPWGGSAGFIQDLWTSDGLQEAIGFDPDPAHTHVFLCGNPVMAQEMTKRLLAGGFSSHSRKQPGNIHAEKYW